MYWTIYNGLLISHRRFKDIYKSYLMHCRGVAKILPAALKSKGTQLLNLW